MNSKKAIISVIVLAVIAIGGYFLLHKQPAVNETIKIGAILPLSGKIAVYGESIKAGLDLSLREINDANGVNDRKLEIIYEDNQGDTKQGVTSYQKLKQINAIDFFLTVPSPVTLAVAPLAENEQSLIFDIGGGAPQVSQAGDYVFRNALLPETESKFLAEFLTNKLKFSKVALLVVNTESGIGYKDEFIKNFENSGGKIVTTELYEKGSIDFRTPLTKIKQLEKEINAIIGISYIQEYGVILKQKKEMNIHVPVFGVYTAEGPQLIEIAGNAAEGLVFTSAFDPESKSDITQGFQERFYKQYGKKADYFAALAYDALKIYAEAMTKCSNITPVCVKDSLYTVKDFPGVTGKTTIDADGDTDKAVILKTVKNGQFVPYEE